MAAAIFVPVAMGLLLQLLNVALAALEARGDVTTGEARRLTGLIEAAVAEGREITTEERVQIEAFITEQRRQLHS